MARMQLHHRSRKFSTGKLFQPFIIIPLIVFAASAALGQKSGSHVRASPPKVSLSQPLTVRWRYSTNETLNLTPAADNERIYLPLASGLLVSLNASDGHLYWKSEIGGEFSASPV